MTTDTLTAEQSRDMVRRFLAAWADRDIDMLMSFFSDDAIYHNVPVAPARGLTAIRAIFSGFLDSFSEISLDIVAIAAEPNLVFAERIDRFELNGRRFDLPVNGVFEIRGGKITRFSDYFDLASFESQSGLKL